MSRARKRGLPLYLIPIVVGMCGVLFAQQIESPGLRITVILASVAAPLFAGGIILGRLHSQGIERVMVVAGLTLLCVGALATASGFTEDLTKLEEVPAEVIGMSRYIGLASLFLGIIAIFVLLVRREEVIGEVGDRFRHLAEHMGDGFILMAPDGAIILVNQRFLDMAGLRESDVVGHNARELADRLGLDTVVDQIDRRNQSTPAEYQLSWRVHGEDRYFWMTSTPILSRRGQRSGTIATVRDITERTRLAQRLEKFAQGLQKLVEDRTQQLRQSEERLRDLLLNMNEGFVTLDDSYRIDFANQRFAEMVGKNAKNLKGIEIFNFADPTDRARLYEIFEAVERKETGAFNREITLVQEAGHRIPVVIAASALGSHTEDAPRFSIVLTDVAILKGMQHELEQRAEELQNANEELRMLDRAKDTFLSNVTHELRTPLSTVRGYVEMLTSGSLGELGPTQENALRVMERNLQRLGTLIDEMIEFSRMEIRGIRLSVSLFDLEKTVDEAISSARPQLQARKMTAVGEVADGTRMVWGDRKRIGQVLTILLSNAIKFSHEGDKVTIRVTRKSAEGIVIEVVDTGIGIDPMYHRRIFDKFFQVDSSMNRRYEGAGIGLSIAKSIIEAHGGLIEVTSERGKGSVFRMVLPSAVFDVPENTPILETSRNHGLRLLVIEDEADFRGGLVKAAETGGFRTAAAASGHEGIRIAAETAPDVVVIGPSLPDLPPMDVTQRLREQASDLPVLRIVTAAVLADNLHGRTEQLEMPFSGDEFLTAILRLHGVEHPGSPEIEPGPTEHTLESRAVALMVDSDAEFLEWAQGALGRRQILCLTAPSRQDALELAHRNDIDAVFVDIDDDIQAGEISFETFRDAFAARSVPVFATTSLPVDAKRAKGYQGALQKPFDVETMVGMVSAVHREPLPIK